MGQYHFLHEDYLLAMNYFRKAASIVPSCTSGERDLTPGGYDMQAKYQLGVMYYDGLGVSPDPVIETGVWIHSRRCLIFAYGRDTT